VTIGTTNIVPPVFTASKIVSFFLTSMTDEAGLRNLFGALILEGDDLFWIAFLQVSFTWTMTGFTASHLSIPTTQLCKLSV